MMDATELERALDHFIHAKWMRTTNKEQNTLKAIDYTRNLNATIPNVVELQGASGGG